MSRIANVSENSREGEQRIDSKLAGMAHDAEGWYAYLRKKHDDETSLEIVVVTCVALLASVIGLAGASLYVYHSFAISNWVLYVAGVAAITAAAGLATWAVRRRRRFQFAELGSLVEKMKGGQASAEDGLRLIDSMHEALLAIKKDKMDSAFTNGAVAFVVVALFGMNVAVGLLTGAIVYLYFRFEAIREYENESRKYEESKREFVQSL